MQCNNLTTSFLGRKIIHYKEIDSTQTRIWKMIEENKIENGTLIYADIQTAGKGTHGRLWHTDEKNNIAFSFFIKMDCDIEKLEGLTRRIAELIITILKNNYGIHLTIKEPNDIMLKEKKIGGILTETRMVANKVKYLVVGIGINTSKQEFTDDIKEIATSIKKEFNININVIKLMTEFCNQFEKEILERMELS